MSLPSLLLIFPMPTRMLRRETAIARANCGTVAAPVACSPTTGFVTNDGSTANPLRSVDPDLKIPESYQFNIGFEREIGKGLVFEANYTWNRTTRLWREFNINVPVVPSGFSDLTAWLLVNPYTFRNFNNTIRTYQFYLGNTNDQMGVATADTTGRLHVRRPPPPLALLISTRPNTSTDGS